MNDTIDTLIQYLDSEDNKYGLTAIETHGFLTASIIGPELSDWMSVYFDAHNAEVDVWITQALTSWRTQIAMELDHEQPLADLPDADLECLSEWQAWSLGFIEAMEANDQDWLGSETDIELADLDEDSSEIAVMTLPMIILSNDDDADFDGIYQNEALLLQFIQSIADNIVDIYLIFHTPD